MKSDRELLELAAKAAGYDVVWNDHWKCYQHRNPVPDKFGAVRHQWVPLDDDGDALRLAVKLHISPSWSPSKNSVKASINDDPFLIFGMDATGDDCADVRRIIVRAAAAIGKAMQ